MEHSAAKLCICLCLDLHACMGLTPVAGEPELAVATHVLQRPIAVFTQVCLLGERYGRDGVP